jgi:hypothetical protein
MPYSPKINFDLVKKLYLLKQTEKKPMTKLVNEAVTQYLERKRSNGKEREEPAGSDS